MNLEKDVEIIRAATWLKRAEHYEGGEKGLLEDLKTMTPKKAKKILKVDDAEYKILKRESISLSLRNLKKEVEEGKVKL